ncbi:MAG TPA: DUF255 domain-containing protein [Candidatus Omnitrophota bacterium]|nr:DUF255 domain-containing protein [Candidatus Omnitrophota bacterium]
MHIAASWSRSGRQMDFETWTDTSVVRVVNQSFIPVRVDADRRPDIADRYLSGGWPTTAVLSHDGQVLMAQSVVAPQALRQMLEKVRDFYRQNRSEIEFRAGESARRIERTWKSEPLVPSDMTLEDWVDRNLAALREAEDHVHGGIEGAPKQPQFEAAHFLLSASAARGDRALRSLGLRVLDAALHLEDSTWGGFFRIAGDEEWKKPRTEKLLDVNARATAALVAAVEQGGGTRYREAARRTEAYAATWLWAPRLGGWYGSQAADVVVADGRLLGGDVYYGLPDALRRKQGVPAIDSSLYAEQNARMAAAVLHGAAAGIWKGAPVARAVKALDRLWTAQRAPDGSLYHEWREGRLAVPGRLMDQAAAGLAYLEAYAATKEPRHLARAESLAVWIRTHLEDPVTGGFRYAPRDPRAIGRLAAGEKPEQGNLDAGWLFFRLWQLNHRAEDRRSAERAMEQLRSGDVVVLDPAQAELGLALEKGSNAKP